jgi:uncharacterized protein (UPF0261 family)
MNRRMPTIAILGTLDTKGVEHGFVADLIRQRGHRTLVIDVGALEPPTLPPDLTREAVAKEGGVDLAALVGKRDRGEMVAAMAGAAAKVVGRLAAEGRIDGVISLGGGGGTTIGTTAMRALPIGFPKVMVSTLASGDTSPFVGTRDIVMIPSVVDVAGINRISRPILARAAGAICGMVETQVPAGRDKPLITASMFGNTTDCVSAARKILEEAGYEVLVFHATGTGGRTMESLIDSGMITGVLDITTTEWADELVGGILNAGPTRLEAAGRTGTPAIVTPGCIDMVNFGPRDTVPAKFAGRKFYQHNPNVTLMRLTKEESAKLGEIFAAKLNAYTGPVTVLLPQKGFSVIGEPGKPFHDPFADEAFFQALKQHLKPGLPVIEMDCPVNAPEFAKACAAELLKHIAARSRHPS